MKQPNILYIMSDGHAANAISCYGSRLTEIAPTPNIDRIASEGVRLGNCFCTNAICTPSRAVIMTGQHSHVNGVYTLRDDLDPKRRSVAQLLQNAGYQTAIVGKWHLHTQPQGFDYYNVLPGQGRYFDPRLKEKGKVWQDHNQGGEVYEGYVTDVTTDISLEWLGSRDRQKPFFLMCHNKAPHGLWEYHPRHESLFDGADIPEPRTLFEDKSHRCEGSLSVGSTMLQLSERMSNWERGGDYPTGNLNADGLSDAERIRAAYQKYLKDYLRCVAAIDENVGRLLDYLDEEGIADDTVVIYTSDQGMFLGEHEYYDKRLIYEESLRMPLVARYPREIAAGSTNDDIILNLDFAETFLDYAGAPIPDDMQGRTARANLAGDTPADWRQSMYYRYWMHEMRPAHYGIRAKRYKLIFFYGLPLDATGTTPDPTPPGMELYDLEKDPFEQHNVYSDPAYADVAEELKAELLRLKEEAGDTDEKYPELMERRRPFFEGR